MILLALLAACGGGASAPPPGEVCNGLDDDGNGLVDDGWDLDGDGYSQCAAPEGPVDCDDANPAVHPGAVELCNGIDDNCDGDVDGTAADRPTWWVDADGDGYGDPDAWVLACEAPEGAVGNDQDCDDTDPAIHPGATETWYDGVDTDCDGDDDFDQDGDGWPVDAGDCDDLEPTTHPGADEVCGDGVNSDCGVYELDCTAAAWGGWLPTLWGSSRHNYAVWFGTLGDTDGDGIPEVGVTATLDPTSYELVPPQSTVVVEGAPEGDGLILGSGTILDGELISPTALGDIDGDGLDDAIFSNLETFVGFGYVDYGPVLTIELGPLHGHPNAEVYAALFPPLTEGAVPGSPHIVSGDIDGDSLQEPVIPILWGGGIGDAVGSVVVASEIPAGHVNIYDLHPRIIGLPVSPYYIMLQDVASGDLDGDGLDDVVLSDNYADLGAGAAWFYLAPFESDLFADQTDGYWRGYYGTGTGHAIMLDDLTGDGHLDLVIDAPFDLDGTRGGALYVVDRPLEGGVVPDAAVFTVRGMEYGDASAFELPDRTADLDGDGKTDLPVFAWDLHTPVGSGAIEVFHGPFSGTRYVEQADIAILQTPDDPVWGMPDLAVSDDLDGDGLPDLVFNNAVATRDPAHIGALVYGLSSLLRSPP